MSLPAIGLAAKALFSAIGSAAPAIQAGLSIGSTALGFAQSSGQAAAMEEQNEQTREEARQYMIQDYDQTNRLLAQEKTAAGQRLEENQIEGAQTRATAKVAASAGGVSGLSVDALLGDIYGREASIRDSVNQNLENTTHQVGVERQGIYRQTLGTYRSLPVPQKPSLLGAALEGATGVYGAYKDKLRVRAKSG